MQKILSGSSVRFFVSVMGLIALFAVLKELQHIFIPFVIAYFMFFVFQPLNTFITKKKIPYGIAIVVDILIVTLIFVLLSQIIIASFARFGEAIPEYEQKFTEIITAATSSLGIINPIGADINLLEYLNNTFNLGEIAGGVFNSTMSFFSSLMFVIFFFLFISTGHSKIVLAIKRRYNRYINKEKENEKKSNSEDTYIERTFEDIPAKIQNYIATKFVISLGTAMAVGFVLYLFDVDFTIVWIVLAFLLNFIPNIGSIIAVILPSVVALIQFESAGYALIIAAVLAVVQNIFGSIIEPKIMGDKLGINPIVILLSLLLWGYIWGITGMFLSVPLTAVFKISISGSNSPDLKFINDLMG